MRAADAEALLATGRHSAAYYLAGYAVECGLKCVIASSFRAAVLPSPKFVQAIHTHDLVALVSLAQLKPALDARITEDPDFAANWAFTTGWKESSRYEFIDPLNAARMLSSVTSEPSGVLPWLKTIW